jgi:hypothetical protein
MLTQAPRVEMYGGDTGPNICNVFSMIEGREYEKVSKKWNVTINFCPYYRIDI